jgi:hypothetical protein
MPNNKNRDEQGNQGRERQGNQGGQGERQPMSGGSSGLGSEIERDEDQDFDREEENQDREMQSGGRGQTGGKQRDIKIGHEDEEEAGRSVQRNEDSELDENTEPLDEAGGDSRASVRSDGRNDGKPDEPMPSPYDGSQK